jgi:hypothetical protein
LISERAMRAVLIVLGVVQVASGALALVAPDTFFDEIGRYGVQNDHYIGDVGAFVLAFGVAVLIAAQRPAFRVPVLVLGALWSGLHTINHAFDVGDARSDARGIVDTLYLGAGALLYAYLAWAASRLQAPGAASPARGEERS